MRVDWRESTLRAAAAGGGGPVAHLRPERAGRKGPSVAGRVRWWSLTIPICCRKKSRPDMNKSGGPACPPRGGGPMATDSFRPPPLHGIYAACVPRVAGPRASSVGAQHPMGRGLATGARGGWRRRRLRRAARHGNGRGPTDRKETCRDTPWAGARPPETCEI